MLLTLDHNLDFYCCDNSLHELDLGTNANFCNDGDLPSEVITRAS